MPEETERLKGELRMSLARSRRAVRVVLAVLALCVVVLAATVIALGFVASSNRSTANAAHDDAATATRKADVAQEKQRRIAAKVIRVTRLVNRTIYVAGKAGIRGMPGPNGTQGPPGIQGVQGRPPAAAEVATAVFIYCRAHDGCRGPQGPKGEDGADGADGAGGVDGADGAQGPQGEQGPAPASIHLTDSTGQRQTCTDPDGDLSYDCTPDPS